MAFMPLLMQLQTTEALTALLPILMLHDLCSPTLCGDASDSEALRLSRCRASGSFPQLTMVTSIWWLLTILILLCFTRN